MDLGVSPYIFALTVIIIVAGFIITIFAFNTSLIEVRKAWGQSLEQVAAEYRGEKSPWLYSLGAAIAGIVAATLVGLYGLGGWALYLGPIAAFVGSVGIMWNYGQQIADFNREAREEGFPSASDIPYKG